MQDPKIIKDSLNIVTGDRLITVLIPLWKPLQAQLRTHRGAAHSESSSRAIPTAKITKALKQDPFIPLWVEYRPGMSGADTLPPRKKTLATITTKIFCSIARLHVEILKRLGIAKEQRNRYLEPWTESMCVMTANLSYWDYFFELRTPDHVQPELREQARKIKTLILQSKPERLYIGEWHLPFVSTEECTEVGIEVARKMSAARCARTSYLNHDGTSDPAKDIKTHDKLKEEKHMTPFEHQQKAVYGQRAQFHGFCPYRWELERDA